MVTDRGQEAGVDVLLVVMLAGAASSLALGLAGWRGVGRGWLVAEAAMLAAMLDVHLPALHLLPAPLWSALLAGCALVAALVDRVRRGRGVRRHGADALHAVGMLLAAVLVLLADAAPTAGALAGAGHAHGGGLALPLGAAVAVYATCTLRIALAGRPGRLDTARRLASLAALVAMGAMAAVG
ncbi:MULTISPECIES: hypothetical protein [unclassified Rathayibacter]|uniref:hypothetical protein n=1 Tax=unclassified Rathayibacter TaxID=2609250 RepID=UPI001044A844|nr:MULTISPECIES: hypothetical protein [unclassified Rathayibacter]MCJ1703326.1 hypothetical protein [Rathayibacter sp. VKM Ac-2926]